jgi:hypothetical protein
MLPLFILMTIIIGDQYHRQRTQQSDAIHLRRALSSADSERNVRHLIDALSKSTAATVATVETPSFRIYDEWIGPNGFCSVWSKSNEEERKKSLASICHSYRYDELPELIFCLLKCR